MRARSRGMVDTFITNISWRVSGANQGLDRSLRFSAKRTAQFICWAMSGWRKRRPATFFFREDQNAATETVVTNICHWKGAFTLYQMAAGSLQTKGAAHSILQGGFHGSAASLYHQVP